MNKIGTLLSLAMATTLIAMDPPAITEEFTVGKFEQVKQRPKKVVHGTLSIDSMETCWLFGHPHGQGIVKDCPIQYFGYELRKSLLEKGTNFESVPLNIPFVLVVITPEDNPHPSFFSILPATELINLNNGSTFSFSSDKCVFNLVCTENKKLKIKDDYFPQDKNGITFETQFLTCLNEFCAFPEYYAPSDYYPEDLLQEFLKCKILRKGPRILRRIVDTDNPSVARLRTDDRYFHDINGCSKPEDLTKLATTPTTKPYGGVFNYVQHRQIGSRYQR